MTGSRFHRLTVNKFAVSLDGMRNYARWEAGNDGRYLEVAPLDCSRFNDLAQLREHLETSGVVKPKDFQVHHITTVDINYYDETDTFKSFVAKEITYEAELVELKRKYGKI